MPVCFNFNYRALLNCLSLLSVEGEAAKSEDFFTEGQKVEIAKEDMAYSAKSRNFSQFLRSQMRIEESDAGRILLQEYQRKLGHPIANFESFTLSATPAITFSCMDNQMSKGPFLQMPIPNILLQAVWERYEIPGNYGLEVKARDTRNINGESTSFCQYFVPSLSAVQLFGYPRRSDDLGKNRDIKSDLLFEFFETKLPHLRKPLHLKIKDLVSMKTSNLQVSGDSSNLESMYLHELHPDTWFSVYWHPTCRIPDRKFNASFLTYHSLRDMFVQSMQIDPLRRMFRIVLPVMGLKSYKTEGECWFDPWTHVEYSLEKTKREILRRRRTLEQKARGLSTAIVTKLNQHPDYEFFTDFGEDEKKRV